VNILYVTGEAVMKIVRDEKLPRSHSSITRLQNGKYNDSEWPEIKVSAATALSVQDGVLLLLLLLLLQHSLGLVCLRAICQYNA
jgi:hypothetical protein